MDLTSHHTIDCPWDAPFERVRIAFSYTPGTADIGPTYSSGGTPGEPDSVEPLLCRARIAGAWHDMPECILQEMGKLLEDDMIEEAKSELEEGRSYARAETREMVEA